MDFLVRFVVADDHDFGLCLVSAVRIIRNWVLLGIVHVFRWGLVVRWGLVFK